MSIQQLIDFAAAVIARRPAEQTTGLKEFKRHAAYIAGYQVRSAGSVAGNIFITKDHADHGGPFPSDVFTVLASLGTKVTIGSMEYPDESKTFLLTEMPAPEDLPEELS